MICTFYSYKGGVGRSMAMANVADLLARRGLKVLMVDFDLEAPGLEQFFQVNQEGIRRRRGLLDLLLAYKRAMSLGRPDDAEFRQLLDFISPVYEQLPGGGRLDILSAGQRQDAEQLTRYALQLRTFDWQDFYYNWQGELFFEWFRRTLTPDPYDLVLVDSRTGVTEMGGICGYQLADAIVMMCAANHQNIEGTANMVRDFRSPTVEALRRGRQLDLIVVPARIEQRDAPLLTDFVERFDAAFEAVLPKALLNAGLHFRDLMIPYDPHFAFTEIVLSDPDHRQRISAAFDQLAKSIQLLADPREAVGRAGAERAVGVASTPEPAPAASAPAPAPPAEAQFDPAKRFAGYDVFLDSHVTERAAITDVLRSAGISVFGDRFDLLPGDEWRAVLEEALFHSRVLLTCIGPGGMSIDQQATVERAVAARSRGQSLAIIPVVLPGGDFDALAQTRLATFQAIDLRQGFDAAAVETLVRAVRAACNIAVEPTRESRAPFRGLQAFQEYESDLFFGRDRVVAELAQKVEDQRTVIVVGPPRCGKTSLIQAGLIPRLRASQKDGTWKVIEVSLFAGVPDLQATYERAVLESSGEKVLLVLDDLEALFASQVSDETRTAFLAAFGTLAGSPPPGSYLVATLRSDYLDRLPAGPLREIVEGATFPMPLLSADELRVAIERPAEKVGLAFEPGLAERILADIRDQPGALPWLQLLLARLWEERRGGWLTNAAYDAAGGIGGVLAARAEEFYRRLTEPEQTAVHRALLRLARPGSGGRNTRRAVELARVAASFEKAPGQHGDTDRKAFHDMIDAGLLVVSSSDGKTYVDVAHEGLLRKWSRLSDWLDDERAFLLWRDRLSTSLELWSASARADNLLRGAALAESLDWLRDRRDALGSDEVAFIERSGQSRDRQRRFRVGMLSGVVVLLSVSSIVAFQQRNDAVRAQAVAERKTELAEEALNALRNGANDLQKLATQDDTSAAAQQADAGKLVQQLNEKVEYLQRKSVETKNALVRAEN